MPRSTTSTGPNQRRGGSRKQADDWVLAGLEVMAAGSIAEVKVERLAKHLGVTKGSFYWHFDDRSALLEAMGRRWVELDTESVISFVDGTTPADDPEAAIEQLFTVVFGQTTELDGVEAAIREWSASDPVMADLCRTVDERRLAYVTGHLVATGLDEDEARRRAEVIYRIVIGEYVWRRYGGEPIETSAAIDAVRRLIRN